MISENQFIINHRPTPILIRIILSIILLICGVIPLFAAYFVLSQGEGPKITLFLAFGLFWGLGFFMLRILLWNTFGREIISLDEKQLTYLADYKFFKDGRKQLEIENIKAAIIQENSKRKRYGRLIISNGKDSIETVLESSIADLQEMLEIIEKRYNHS